MHYINNTFSLLNLTSTLSTQKNTIKQSNQIYPKAPNSPKADLRSTDGEKIIHQAAELYEMIKDKAKKLGAFKENITQNIMVSVNDFITEKDMM